MTRPGTLAEKPGRPRPFCPTCLRVLDWHGSGRMAGLDRTAHTPARGSFRNGRIRVRQSARGFRPSRPGFTGLLTWWQDDEQPNLATIRMPNSRIRRYRHGVTVAGCHDPWHDEVDAWLGRDHPEDDHVGWPVDDPKKLRASAPARAKARARKHKERQARR